MVLAIKGSSSPRVQQVVVSIHAAAIGLAASSELNASPAVACVWCSRLNQLTPPKTTPEIIKFLLQFTNPLMALLLVAGALTFMAYALQSPRDKNNAILAAALIIVVTLTCVMSYLQERSASNVMGESCGLCQREAAAAAASSKRFKQLWSWSLAAVQTPLLAWRA